MINKPTTSRVFRPNPSLTDPEKDRKCPSYLNTYDWSILKNMFFGKFTGLLDREEIHPINLHRTETITPSPICSPFVMHINCEMSQTDEDDPTLYLEPGHIVPARVVGRALGGPPLGRPHPICTY
jgi:hypothetical protein